MKWVAIVFGKKEKSVPTPSEVTTKKEAKKEAALKVVGERYGRAITRLSDT